MNEFAKRFEPTQDRIDFGTEIPVSELSQTGLILKVLCESGERGAKGWELAEAIERPVLKRDLSDVRNFLDQGKLAFEIAGDGKKPIINETFVLRRKKQ